MTIDLYTISDDPRVVDKTLGTAVASITDAIRGPVSEEGGTITIDSTTDLSSVNYAHISDFSRYYYVEQITALRNNIWTLTLRPDVLMSFASGIKALTGTIDRNEGLADAYLQDGQYVAKVYKQITTKAFPNSMDSDSIILMTVG